MRKTEQTLTYTIEGPDARDRYRVTYPGGYETGWCVKDNYGPTLRQAIQAHIDSAPQVVEFKGYLIGRHSRDQTWCAWALADHVNAERGLYGIAGASNVGHAYEQIAACTQYADRRQYIAPLLALAHYLAKEEQNG